MSWWALKDLNPQPRRPKSNMIHKQLKAMYEAVMKRGGPKGVITQSIVDEYHKMVKEESEPELETKKIRISFLKKKKTH